MRTQAGRMTGRVRRSAHERRELLRAYEGSGLSKAAFCRQREIHLTTFCRWFNKRLLPAPRWAEVQVQRLEPIPQMNHAAPLELELRSGVRMAVRDVRWLSEVAGFVRTLEGRPC